jgi:hypothetical protein
MKRFLALAAMLVAPVSAFAFPVDVSGTVDVTAGINLVADFDATLLANHTMSGTLTVFGFPQAFNGTWRNSPRGVVLTVPNLITIGGQPVNGCITGANNQPTPAILLGFGATPTMRAVWDVCAVP